MKKSKSAIASIARNRAQKAAKLEAERGKSVTTLTQRRVRISNVYVGGPTIDVEWTVHVRERRTDETSEDYDWYLGEALWEYTGTSRSGDACYFLESIDDVEPKLKVEWC